MSVRTSSILDPNNPCSPLSIPASKTAVLLLDYQNLTVSYLGEDGKRTVAVAAKIRQWALRHAANVTGTIPVYHCVVDTKTTPVSTSKLSARWTAHEERLVADPGLGSEPEELLLGSELTDEGRERVFARRPGYVSALCSPGLLEELKKSEIESLILCGLSTSGCVLSTCRAATDLGFVVTVVEDACFDPVPNLHNMLVRHVLSSTAHVLTWEEMEGAFETI